MEYKKIILKPKSWIITALESDTILSYVFAWSFLQKNDKIINIFENFKEWEIPFLITNAFVSWENKVFISKPIFFLDKKEKKDISLQESIKKESTRKKFKKANVVAFDKNILKNVFEKELSDEEKQQIIQWKESYEKYTTNEQIWKNTIPRFNSGETNPYMIDVNFYNELTIYVKIFDKEKIDNFFDFMKNIFENIGFGAGKSRGFWKFEKIDLQDLSESEKDSFDYLQELEKQGKKLVLNNYKPTDEELNMIDFKNSFIDINWKNTKTTQELNKDFFKWSMNFINVGSVLSIKSNEEIKWGYYKSGISYNFGYLF